MAKSKPKPMNPFAGRWRIVSMSAWDQDFIDEEEEGFFEFDEQSASDGYGCDFHPSKTTQAKMSGKLVPTLKTLMGW